MSKGAAHGTDTPQASGGSTPGVVHGAPAQRQSPVPDHEHADFKLAPPPSGRVNVLAYPAPSTTRFLILVAALLAGGLFAGNWIYNATRGAHFSQSFLQCGTAFSISEGRDHCQSAVLREVAVARLLGAGAVVLGALVILGLTPVVVSRRRRLRALPSGLTDIKQHVEALAQSQGVASPGLLMGSTSQRDAFTIRSTRKGHQVVLPRALVVRWKMMPGSFDALIRHELAHIRHRDVTWSWLARSALYALLPLMAAPILVDLFRRDASLVWDSLWRFLVLAAVVVLTSRALLRSREFDADLLSTNDNISVANLQRLLDATRPPKNGPARILAHHPDGQARKAVLVDPTLHARVGLFDGFLPAVLAGMAWPLVQGTFTQLLGGTGRTGLGIALAAGAAGALLGTSVGLALWRAAHVRRLSQLRFTPVPAALGVGAGLVLGQLASLNGSGLGFGFGGLLGWPSLVVLLAGTGAAMLSAGLGELWADFAPRLRSSVSSWSVALVVNTLLFALFLWMAAVLETFTSQNSGWHELREALVFGIQDGLAVVLAAAIGLYAIVCVLARPRSAGPPSWLQAQVSYGATWRSSGRRWTPLLAGCVSAAAALTVVIIHRERLGSIDAAATQRLFYVNTWIYAGAAALVYFGWCLATSPRHAGEAFTAATTSMIGSIAGFLVYNTIVRGNHLFWEFAFSVLRSPVMLAFGLLAVVGSLLIALPSEGVLSFAEKPGVQTRRATAALAAAWLGILVTGTLGFGAIIIGQQNALTTIIAQGEPAPGSRVAPSDEALRYVNVVSDNVVAAHRALLTQVQAAVTDQSATVAQLDADFQDRIIPQTREFQASLSSFQSGDPNVNRVHGVALDAVTAELLQYEQFANYLETGDPASNEAALRLRDQQVALWLQWDSEVRALGSGHS